MSDFFKRDSVLLGFAAVVGSALLTALLLWAALAVAGVDPSGHYRWFAACFVAPVLLLRHFAKTRQFPTATKTSITLLFVLFVAFMFFLLKTGGLTLQS